VLWRCSTHGASSGQGGLRILQMYLKSGGVYVCVEEGGMSDCPELKSELLRSPFHSLR
jgi:hypothetical protein